MAGGKFILRMTHIVNLGLPRQSDPSKIDNICVCIVFIFNLWWVTIDYKKIHLSRRGKSQAESTELMIALFFLLIQ